MLELKDVHTYYGNIHALKGISLKVEDGEIVTLIGSNGAGKSTTLRTIQGINRPRSGTILLEGTALETLPPHEIAMRGVAQSPEGRLIFPRMTVLVVGATGSIGHLVVDEVQDINPVQHRLIEIDIDGCADGGAEAFCWVVAAVTRDGGQQIRYVPDETR